MTTQDPTFAVAKAALPVVEAVAATLSLAGPVAAHGIEATDRHKPQQHTGLNWRDLWNFIANPAEAAAHVSVSVADGVRRIKADGIPDHQPGGFPNSGNPHSIS